MSDLQPVSLKHGFFSRARRGGSPRGGWLPTTHWSALRSVAGVTAMLLVGCSDGGIGDAPADPVDGSVEASADGDIFPTEDSAGPKDACSGHHDGYYCGPSLGLAASSLVQCLGGKIVNTAVCAKGCAGGPYDGTDACRDDEYDPCSTAKVGDGTYCGKALDKADESALYGCKGGKTDWIKGCGAAGCTVAPPGTPDTCNAPAGDSTYRVPFKCGETHKVFVGINMEVCGGGKHHSDPPDRYAVDFSAAAWTEVRATRGGTVKYANFSVKPGDKCWDGFSSGCDNCNHANYVVVDHGDGTQALYLHLWEIDVKVGQKVPQGLLLGKVGNAGCSSGPHLHFAVADTKCGHWYCNTLHVHFEEAAELTKCVMTTSHNGCS